MQSCSDWRASQGAMDAHDARQGALEWDNQQRRRYDRGGGFSRANMRCWTADALLGLGRISLRQFYPDGKAARVGSTDISGEQTVGAAR